MSQPPDELIARIAGEKARLVELQKEGERRRRRLADLEERLTRFDASAEA